MKVALKTLKYYVDIPVSVEELCDKMVSAGFEVEEVIHLADTMKKVVVGKILSIVPHENSDHLQICQIDIGTGHPQQIVTGAQNIFEGALVPVALPGSDLPGGTHIESGKLRGVQSDGMLCSGGELGLSESDYPGAGVNGILILKDGCAPTGTDMCEVLGLDDTVIDFKITANRPDCNCILGIAKEIGVVLGTTYHQPEPAYKTAGGNIRDEITVEVKNSELCPRYMGRVVKNLRIKESPDWLKQVLRTCGMRPINNIVDITNFVMLETGQPMHAFNLGKLSGRHIIVRNAQEGESITTLDGKKYDLTPQMLVIADGQTPSCLAGIMGGLESEITEDTTDLFLESAKFKRDNIRRTGRALGVRTEASGRYERGTDIHNVAFAMDRALSLIADLGAGDIIDGTVDLHDTLPKDRVLNVSVASICDLLGVEIPEETVVRILSSLQLKTKLHHGMLTVTVPSIRDDIEGKADLAEEVMRIYGYDHIQSTPMRGAVRRGKILPERMKTDRVKREMVALSAREIMTYSFIASRSIDTLFLAEDDPRRNQIRLLNPLGDEYSVLRTQLITGMLTVLSTNMSRKIPAVRFFETSKRFIAKQLPLTEAPAEVPTMSIGIYGEKEDFFTMKGIIERLLSAFGVTASYERSTEPYLHPGRQAVAMSGENCLAVFGEVHPNTAAAYHLGEKVYVAEVYLDALFAQPAQPIVYRPLPKFPAVTRDFALVCDRETPVGKLSAVIRKAAGDLCEEITLFDVYEGEHIQAGKKSVAFSVRLRSMEGTLQDEQIDAVVGKILQALDAAGAQLRS